MTTFSTVAVRWNQYCVSLLNEVRSAIEHSDWPGARARLSEFTQHSEGYWSAVTDLLHPYFVADASIGRARLRRIARQQRELRRRRDELASSIAAKCRAPCDEALQALVALLAAYGHSERHLMATLPAEESLLKAFAARLPRPLTRLDACATPTLLKPLV